VNLYKKLETYADSDYYPFHMPGHKRREYLDMKSPYYYDITEIDGFDNLHEAEDVLARGMEEAARLYHTKSTHFLINGSTSGILAAISAMTKPGDEILMARNCHKAVYNAVFLRGLIPNYLYPLMISEYNIAGAIQVEDVISAFQSKKNIAAVVITSPTYDGVVSDIKAIAKVVHANKSILIVDEAHGAHFPFHDGFPQSAIECDADIVIQSIHKTLPALTQTALLHRISDRVDIKRLQKYLSIYQSSSPSYILMSSVDRCLKFLSSSKEVFDGYLLLLEEFYNKTDSLKNLTVWKPLKCSEIYNKDSSKLLICAKSSEISGVWIYEQLLLTYHIQAEMVMKDYVVCLSSVCDSREGFERLINALHLMDQQVTAIKKQDITLKSQDYTLNSQNSTLQNQDTTLKTHNPALKDENLTSLNPPASLKTVKMLTNELVVLPSKVEDYEHTTKLLIDCEGEVAAEYIYLYPPGIPLVVPGERLTKSFLVQLIEYKAAGLTLRGMSDQTGAYLDVLQIGEKD
jgi:arginine/lysine/ornithine decarboxylase